MDIKFVFIQSEFNCQPCRKGSRAFARPKCPHPTFVSCISKKVLYKLNNTSKFNPWKTSFLRKTVAKSVLMFKIVGLACMLQNFVENMIQHQLKGCSFVELPSIKLGHGSSCISNLGFYKEESLLWHQTLTEMTGKEWIKSRDIVMSLNINVRYITSSV